jgi:hypothetical protein
VRAFPVILLLFLSACAASEQPDPGWVAKPKSAVVEKYNVYANRFDTVAFRDYYCTGKRLDSIAETSTKAKTVYSRFGLANTYLQLVPWDYSLAATYSKVYTRDSSGIWQFIGVREDSVFKDEVASTKYTQRDSTGEWHVLVHDWNEWDDDGNIIASLSLNKKGTIVGKKYYYDKDAKGRITRMTQIGLSDTSWFKGVDRYDTNSFELYEYDRSGNLIGIIDSNAPMRYESYSLVIRRSQITVFDTIAWFSREAIPNFFLALPMRKMMKSGMLTVQSRDGTKSNRFAMSLDDRYRLVLEETDSSITKASYFDDNTIRETIRRDSKGEVTAHNQTLRTYDGGNRVLTQEKRRYDAKEKKYIPMTRIHFTY